LGKSADEDSSSTDEDKRGFYRDLERNPTFAAAYARNEEVRAARVHFNARPGPGGTPGGEKRGRRTSNCQHCILRLWQQKNC
jgi:hypothetical protein